MSEINQELELYKSVTKKGFECGWVNENQFFIWFHCFQDVSEFFDKYKQMWGYRIFQNEGVNVVIRDDYIVLDLTAMLEDRDIDIERVFQKEEFKH